MLIANLEYYKVFYYAVKCGSVTRASEVLSRSQPAVSQSLKQLERILGIRLLRRTSRGISPTAEGQLLFSFVEKGYEQFEAGEKRLLQIRNLERGEITIGASDMTLRFFLLPWLERFHETWPGIRMQPVQRIEDIFVIGRKFAGLKGKEHPVRILEELPLIMMESCTSTRKYVQGFLEDCGVTVSPEFELATSDMIVQFAIRNLGVGSVVKDFAREQLQAGLLDELKLFPPIPPRDFLLVTSEREQTGLAASRLLEMILEKKGDRR